MHTNKRFSPCFAGTALLMLVLAAQGPLHAAEAESERAPKLFESDEILSITLTAPWHRIERDREYQGTYPATIEFQGPDGEAVARELTVERRGVKRQEACRFPPIRLRFEKEAVKGTVFRGEDSLKMVTHCQKPSRHDQYYLVEMMAYRMYNQVTDYSFRVRPLSVTYKDSEENDVDEDRFAFVIEDDSDVGKRNGLRKLEIPKIYPSRLDSTASTDFSLFQLLVGNTDWSALRGPDPAECCHNVKLIAPRPFEDGDKAIPLPYDFDVTGLVDAPYASPPEGLGLRSVTTRLYRGYCAHNATLEASRQKYLSLESDIMAVLDSDPRLSERTRKKTTKYLERFFELLRDDKDFEEEVVMKCRK